MLRRKYVCVSQNGVVRGYYLWKSSAIRARNRMNTLTFSRRPWLVVNEETGEKVD